MPNGPVDVFLIVGGVDLTPDTHEMSDSTSQLLQEVRPFGTAWDKHRPIGVGQVGLTSGGGLYTDRQKGMIAALQTKVGVRQACAYGFEGNDPGAGCTVIDGPIVSKFNRVADIGALTKASPEYMVTGTPARGVVLHGREDEETADFDTEAEPADGALAPFRRPVVIVSSTLISSSPAVTEITTAAAHGLEASETALIAGHTSTPALNGHYVVDSVPSPTTFRITALTGAGSPGGTGGTVTRTSDVGGFAVVHVTDLDLDTHTALELDVITSADGITFAPLLSFATITDVEDTHVQRVAFGGQVERYNAVDGDFTGSGSPAAKLFVALVRGEGAAA
jgi:hypothetical protein